MDFENKQTAWAGKGKKLKRFAKNISVYLILFVVVLSVAFFYKGMDNSEITVKEVPFSKFVQLVSDEKIESVEIEGTTITGQLSKTNYVYAYAPSISQIMWLDENYLMQQAEEGKITYSSPKPDTGSFWISLLPNIIMIGALIFLFYIMMNQGGVRQIQSQDGQGRRKEGYL